MIYIYFLLLDGCCWHAANRIKEKYWEWRVCDRWLPQKYKPGPLQAFSDHFLILHTRYTASSPECGPPRRQLLCYSTAQRWSWRGTSEGGAADWTTIRYNSWLILFILTICKWHINCQDAVSRRLQLYREITLPMLKSLDEENRLRVVDGDKEEVKVSYFNAKGLKGKPLSIKGCCQEIRSWSEVGEREQ